jgi:hypothetical protein
MDLSIYCLPRGRFLSIRIACAIAGQRQANRRHQEAETEALSHTQNLARQADNHPALRVGRDRLTDEEDIMSNIPAHVPADRVFAFDIFNDPRLKPDLHLGYKQLHAEASDIFYTPLNGGHWVVTRHAAITDIARDTEVFSSRNQEIPKTDYNMQLIPLTLDPPEHTPYRQIFMQLSPRRRWSRWSRISANGPTG